MSVCEHFILFEQDFMIESDFIFKALAVASWTFVLPKGSQLPRKWNYRESWKWARIELGNVITI